MRRAIDELLIKLVAVGKAARLHARRRTDRSGASSGYGKFIGPNSLPKKPAVVNALISSISPMPSSRWPMLMNGGIDGVSRPEHPGHPGADVRAATVCGGT